MMLRWVEREVWSKGGECFQYPSKERVLQMGVYEPKRRKDTNGNEVGIQELVWYDVPVEKE